MSDEWEILAKVYSLLKDENVIDTPATEPIVRFEHPEKLKVRTNHLQYQFLNISINIDK